MSHSTGWAVEPSGDQPMRDRRRWRQQGATRTQVVTGEPAHVFELVVFGAELPADGSRFEPEHQGRGERPGLAAAVDDVVDDDTGLLADLPRYGVLQRLPRLDETGERGVAVRWP